jgi:uncharacterized membrane protein YphA (DoxX/SURF4 family)
VVIVHLRQQELRFVWIGFWLVNRWVGCNNRLMANFTDSSTENRSAEQAFQILRFGFTVAPILAGLDKFFHVMVDWDKYLSPMANNVLAGRGHQFMLVVGIIEIVAGIGVFLKPRIFAYIVAAWLLGIIINLLSIPGYYDIALRDLGLMLGALALARLSPKS